MQQREEEREEYLRYLLEEHERLAKEEETYNEDEATRNTVLAVKTPKHAALYLDLPTGGEESVYHTERIILEENADTSLYYKMYCADRAFDGMRYENMGHKKGATNRYILICTKVVAETDGRQVIVGTDPYGERSIILLNTLSKEEFQSLKGKLLLVYAYQDMEDNVYYAEKIDYMLLRI